MDQATQLHPHPCRWLDQQQHHEGVAALIAPGKWIAHDRMRGAYVRLLTVDTLVQDVPIVRSTTVETLCAVLRDL